MPYISDADARKFEEGLEGLPPAGTAGELNYLFTIIALEYVKAHGLRYAVLNDVMGALTGAQAEFYRRLVSKYEETKISDNGDLYP